VQDKFRSPQSQVFKHLESGPGKLLGLLGSAIIISTVFERIGHPLRSPYRLLVPTGIFLILVVPYLIKSNLPFWRPLFLGLRFIPYNLWLWVFGNIKQRDRLKDVHLVTKFLQESTLFARVVGLKPGVTSKYFILFSHKKETNENNANNHHIGRGDRYRIPGFPMDEAECIIRLWYLAASSLHLRWTDIQAQCSCTWNRLEEKERILSGSLAIVGSPKKNEYAGELMRELRQSEGNHISRQARFYMEIRNDTCYLNGDHLKECMPDSTENRSDGDQLTDYALLMKLPNLLARANQKGGFVLLLAGCKVAGQVALTDWFSEPSNMGDLVSTYGTDPFQIAFKITYKYVPDGLPIILSNEVLHREKISVQSKRAAAAAAGSI
jgi:hypothetical protein